MKRKYKRGDLVSADKSRELDPNNRKVGIVLSEHHNYVNTYNILVAGDIKPLHVKFIEAISESR